VELFPLGLDLCFFPFFLVAVAPLSLLGAPVLLSTSPFCMGVLDLWLPFPVALLPCGLLPCCVDPLDAPPPVAPPAVPFAWPMAVTPVMAQAAANINSDRFIVKLIPLVLPLNNST
jgi:hypothetical protein